MSKVVQKPRKLGEPDDILDDELVDQIETAFVRKEFHQALKLSNSVIENTEERPSRQRTDFDFRLRTSFNLNGTQRTAPLSIRAAPADAKNSDQAVCVAIQSYHELKTKGLHDEKQLGPLLKYLVNNSIHLEVLLVFCQFLFTFPSCKHAAAGLLGETLWNIRCGPQLQKDRNEILWVLGTKMLPFCSEPDFCEHILRALTNDKGWQPFPRAVSFHEHINPDTIWAIRFGIGKIMFVSEEFKQVHLNIVSPLNEVESLEDDKGRPIEDDLDSCLDSRERRIDKKGLDVKQAPKTGGSFYIRLSSKILGLVRNRILGPLFDTNEEAKWVNRGRVVMTILTAFIAWKQRRRLLPAANYAVGQVVQPLAEILDALIPTNN